MRRRSCSSWSRRLEDDLDAGEVDSHVARQGEDGLEPLQRLLVVEARVASAARRPQQTFALVVPLLHSGLPAVYGYGRTGYLRRTTGTEPNQKICNLFRQDPLLQSAPGIAARFTAVSMVPGKTRFAVIPNSLFSSAIVFTSETSAAFDAL